MSYDFRIIAIASIAIVILLMAWFCSFIVYLRNRGPVIKQLLCMFDRHEWESRCPYCSGPFICRICNNMICKYCGKKCRKEKGKIL